MNRKACSELAEVTQRNAKVFGKALIILTLVMFFRKYVKNLIFHSKSKKNNHLCALAT
jgi:hypothetical protein